jgi:hypothetical protein
VLCAGAARVWYLRVRCSSIVERARVDASCAPPPARALVPAAAAQPSREAVRARALRTGAMFGASFSSAKTCVRAHAFAVRARSTPRRRRDPFWCPHTPTAAALAPAAARAALRTPAPYARHNALAVPACALLLTACAGGAADTHAHAHAHAFCQPARSRSKTSLRLLLGRIKLLSNKKEASQKMLRREIADLCAAGKMDSARIRVRASPASVSRRQRVALPLRAHAHTALRRLRAAPPCPRARHHATMLAPHEPAHITRSTHAR